jgi:hypothetical protein
MRGGRQLHRLDEQHEVEGDDLVDDRPGGHGAIELQGRVVLPECGAGGFELLPEVPALIALEEIDDDRYRRRGVDDGCLRLRAAKLGQLQADLLLRRAHPEPFDVGHRGDRFERSDRHPDLVVVVVGPEKLHTEGGQLPLERLVEADSRQEKAVHELPAPSAESGGVGLQRGVEAERRGEVARREAERARGAGALPPRVG